MPTYDYRCPNGHDFEHFYRKISDATAEFTCPVCGAVAVRRVSGGAGLVFKGSGFYLTDYGKNAHRKSGSDGAPSGGATSGGESSSETKSAPKSDAATSDGGSSAKSESSSGSSKSESTTKSAEKPSSSSTKQSGGESK
ncbi:MAG TPA: zinc ribbon domain-containing protein [Gemmatimonadaceae bacterium]|nr:zinc ribbon domain-containing protein [Gemmatimonadaceae bacterium]